MQPTSQHSETSWLRQGLIFGLLLGLITGLFAGMIFSIVSFIYVMAQLYSAGHRVNPLSFFQSPVALALIGQRLLPAALFGLVGGVIGGAVGREERNYHV